MSFHPLGLVLSLLVLAPSLLMPLLPPRGVPGGAPRVSPVLAVLERAGQIGCLLLPACTGAERALAPAPLPVAVGLCLALYYALWVRYYAGHRQAALLYRPLLGLPLPMAWLPALAFLLWGAWTASLPLVAAAVVFAAGHLAVSRATSSMLRRAG